MRTGFWNMKSPNLGEQEKRTSDTSFDSLTADMAIPNFPRELGYTQLEKKKTLLSTGYSMWRQKV